MNREIKFKKNRILFGIIFFSLMLFVSICFLVNPEIFLRNMFMKVEHIQTLGIIGIVYFSALLFSFLKIIKRKYAIQITDEFLIDNSKYESLGEIKWNQISKIKRLKKRNIQLHLNLEDLKNEKDNLLKKLLRFMHNWNSDKSILISSSLLDCSIDELFENITESYKRNK